MRNCPVAAENIEDNVLLKMTFLSFQGTVNTFCNWGGQKQNCLIQISSQLCVPKIIEIGSLLTVLVKK